MQIKSATAKEIHEIMQFDKKDMRQWWETFVGKGSSDRAKK